MTVDLAVSPGGRPADASPIGTPGGRKNWVDQAGGLPRYIRMIAHALIRKGMTPQHAIATAVNRVRKLAAGSTNPKVKAAAAAAVAEWEAKKAKSHVSLAYADDPDALWVDLATLEDADAMLLLDLAPGTYRPPYDWKHGYIPITPAAALSKAKGNKKRASKLLRGGGRTPKVAGSRKPSPNRNPAEIRDTGSAERRSAEWDAGQKQRLERIRSKRAAKAQDDENRGRGVPGAVTAAKRERDRKSSRVPLPQKSPNHPDNDSPGVRERHAAAMAQNAAEADKARQARIEKMRADRAAKKAAAPKPVGRSATHDDRYEVTPKGRAAGLGKPDKSSVSSGGGSVSAPKGASTSASTGDGSPRLSGDTVRRMSDDQLDNALSRLMAAGGKDSHALSLIEKEMDRRDKAKAGGSPKGDTPGAGDTGLDDLTFKADRQSHRFTDDVVRRMSQDQLERSLGTLLSAGYDNDAPAVAKLTAALEAKDPEAAKMYRKGADRTAQDAKAALRFAHGTREQQKADYHAYVEHLAHQAEASDMVGAHALSRASRNTTVRLPDLWSMTPAQIRKHASPELLEWFSKPGNEPLPFDAWRAAHLGATDRRAVESLRRRREQWLSEYG
jgi:hypothetical protein